MLKRKSRLRLAVAGSWFVATGLLGSTRTVNALVRDCFGVDSAATVGVPTEEGCYKSLWDVAVAMEAKNPFIVETYSLCPNTLYEIGDRDPNRPDCFVGGDTTLQLRQYSIVQCGLDGASSNNCTIVGGFNQMVTTAGSYDIEKKNGIVVAGLTFARGRGGALLLAAEGDIEFRDCIFQDHVNDGTIKVVFQAFDDVVENARRQILQVTFDRCVFASNIYPGGVPVGLRQLGLINMRTSAGGVLTITNSLFVGNEFLTDYDFDTYLINVDAGNELNLVGNCFHDNLLEGRGLVHVASASSLGDVRNNAGVANYPRYKSSRNATTTTKTSDKDNVLECDFINVNGTNGECFGFDQATCGLDGVSSPPPSGGGGGGPLETGSAPGSASSGGAPSPSSSASSLVLLPTVSSRLLFATALILLLLGPTVAIG